MTQASPCELITFPTLFSDLMQSEREHWRVAVLGDSGVGKTALAVQVLQPLAMFSK